MVRLLAGTLCEHGWPDEATCKNKASHYITVTSGRNVLLCRTHVGLYRQLGYKVKPAQIIGKEQRPAPTEATEASHDV